jgi:hypothetical protein
MSHISPIRFSYIPDIMLASTIHIEDNVYFKFGGMETLFRFCTKNCFYACLCYSLECCWFVIMDCFSLTNLNFWTHDHTIRDSKFVYLPLAMRMHVLKILKSHEIHWHIVCGGMSLSLKPYILCFKCLRWKSNDHGMDDLGIIMAGLYKK